MSDNLPRIYMLMKNDSNTTKRELNLENDMKK